ncbi:MAG TPA: hypothetical protein VFE65_02010, partial [Pseudonocardia sp.]|nr:hypothetical protein [Pseudonocardia sp.]
MRPAPCGVAARSHPPGRARTPARPARCGEASRVTNTPPELFEESAMSDHVTILGNLTTDPTVHYGQADR